MKTALIIPAYKPDEKMLALLEEFRANDEFVTLVVDDGSGTDFQNIFNAVPDFVTVLRHPQNRGKGAALKTALTYILENLPDCEIALTADADGQHRYADILRINRRAIENRGAMILGSRKMKGDNIPLRSRLGNGITRTVFSAVSGTKVYDTQTGLRAFDREAMQQFVHTSGDRYEYEINVLLEAARSGMPIIEETIETVYLNQNETSHFNVFRDSFKIYACILKYAASSLLAFGVDFVMLLLMKAITASLPERISLLISVIVARIISGTVNFIVNQKVVFKGNERTGKAFLKYAALAVCILGANYVLLDILTVRLHWALALAKIVVEIVLSVVNFITQGKLVYRKRRK